MLGHFMHVHLRASENVIQRFNRGQNRSGDVSQSIVYITITLACDMFWLERQSDTRYMPTFIPRSHHGLWDPAPCAGPFVVNPVLGQLYFSNGAGSSRSVWQKFLDRIFRRENNSSGRFDQSQVHLLFLGKRSRMNMQ